MGFLSDHSLKLPLKLFDCVILHPFPSLHSLCFWHSRLLNHWRVHFFFPGEGFSTQATTNTGIWYDIIIYIVRSVSWVDTWIHMNWLRRIGSTSYIQVLALQSGVTIYFLESKASSKVPMCTRKNLLIPTGLRKLASAWFTSDSWHFLRHFLWWIVIYDDARLCMVQWWPVKIDFLHKNIEMLSCYLRHAA